MGHYAVFDVNHKNNTIGASYLVADILISFLLVTIVKMLHIDFSIFLILFFRYLFCLPLLIIYGVYSRGSKFLCIENIRGLILRSCFGFIGLMMWFLAISEIDISLATALAQTMPIFITILSVFIAGEYVGFRRVMSVIIGFSGVLVLLLPLSPELNLWGVIYALLASLFGALMFVYLRIIGRTDPAISTSIWHNSTGIIFAGVLAYCSNGFDVVVNAKDLSAFYLLIALGILASFQQFCLAQSHMYSQASTLAPLQYLSIPLGVTIGILLFNEEITVKYVIGTAIIIASTYYILVREQTKK